MSMTTSELRTTENLLPNAIRSRTSRAQPFATVVSPDGQLDNISFSDVENASNRAAWYLDQSCAEDQVFVYMGPSDIRYLVWTLAAMKTGKCVVYPSPGNSVSANRKLFLAVEAKKLLFAVELMATSQPLQTATADIVKFLAAPSYSELMSHEETVPVYPFDETWEDIKLTSFMALHTSGTSGHPKPIYWNHLAASIIPSFRDDAFVGPNGTSLSRDLFLGATVLVPFPLFHMGGIGPTIACVFSDNTLVLPKSGTPLSPPNYTAMLEHAGCTTTFAPPAILESLLSYPPGLAALAKLEHVAYTGGPLQPARGAELAKHLKHIFPILASTEGGAAILESSGDSSHWDSFKFIDAGQRMEETTPGFYELVYPRTERAEQSYGFFHVYPHLKTEYRTSDLFSPATGEDGWWIFRGRADNCVVMSNGLKMDPTDLENNVASHPRVKGVLVGGSHRFRLFMLVELSGDDGQKDDTKVLEEIWALLEQGNEEAPKFGRIPRELIIIANPGKPFLRASKGTIQRQLTFVAYQDEIDGLYDRVEKGLLTSGLPAIASTSADDLVPFLVDVHTEALELGDKTLGLDDDLISLGLDSLTAFVLLARLKAALREYGAQEDQLEHINAKLLYSSTTVRKMAKTMSAIFNDPFYIKSPNETKDFEELLMKYTLEAKNLAEAHHTTRGHNAKPRDRGETVLLTGSTGSLGSYILASLLSRPSVKSIVCLNRGPPSLARAKQVAWLAARGLPSLPDAQDIRLSFVQARLSEPNLGLPTDEYAELARRATCVIHNAFPVNWLLDITSFAPQMQALLRLLEFVGLGERLPDIMFVSSIAAAIPISSSSFNREIPETVMSPKEAPRQLIRQGYAQAKYICERILEVYSSSSSTCATDIGVLRVGQICGPVSSSIGVWNPSEWLPSLVISSAKSVRAAPDSLGPAMDNRINWVPVDKLASIVCELLLTASAKDKLTVYNIVNPQPTSWSLLLPALDRIVPQRVPPGEWITKVEGSGNDVRGTNQLHRNPAIKLLDFYKQALLGESSEWANYGLGVQSSNLLEASETARLLGPITQDHMASWIESWGL